jgi:hypothetical protein
MNTSFDTLVSTTLKNYRRQLADNVTGHNVTWFELKERGGIREEDGGTSIVEPLLIARNSTVKSYRGYDVLDTTPQEGISAAEFNWKQVAGSVTISGEEEFKNIGSKTKIISLLDAKVKQLEISLRLELNRQLHSDGTGNGGKDITGLALAVEDGAAWSTYGGIDSNTYQYWRNQWIGTTAAFGTTTSDAGLTRMRTMANSCSRGTTKTHLIITSQQLFEAYEKVLAPSERFLDMRLGDAGFQNLLFKAIPMVFDDDMPVEDLATDEYGMLFLNFDFLNFVIGKGKNFVVTDLVKPDNQDAKVSHTLLYGNLTCSNRARQGRITDLTA